MERPLHREIKEKIIADFLSTPPEQAAERLPSERELQARYQVSRTTISKALAGLTAEGFLENRPKSGYYRLADPAAPPTPEAIQQLIGYVAPLAGEELVQRTFRGIDRMAQRRGYRVLMGNAGNHVGREEAAVRDLIASGARGILITPFPRIGDEERQNDYLIQKRFDVPLVLMDTGMPEQGHTQVIFDNRRAAYNMAHWLHQEGHRRIALLSFVEAILHGPLADRFQGYQDALRDHDLPFDPALVRRYDSREDQSAAIEAILNGWLSLPEPPTAIIAVDDLSALKVIDLLPLRGVKVPDQVTVTGFDNRMVARRFHPSFTTTDPDFSRMGETACDLLLRGIETGALEPHRVVLDLPILIRRDSDVLAVTGTVREAVPR